MGNLSSTRTQIFSLVKALSFQQAMGILIPIILVRFIDVTQYGQYRILWLVASTVMLIAPLGMPRSLMYFLPRSSTVEKRVYVYQVLLFMFVVSAFSAMIVSPLNSLLPEKVRSIANSGIIVPAFVFFWVFSSILDVLPNADLNIRWQSLVIIILTIIRVVIVLGTAIWTRDIKVVFLALITLSIIKTVLLLHYSVKYHGWIRLRIDRKMIWRQLCYAVPFGFANIAHNLRRNAEMWVVASIFSTSTFAIFSIGAMQYPLVNIIRTSIGNVILPKMSKIHADGNYRRLIELNQKGNLVATYLVFPIAAFSFAFCDKIITILFTNNYIQAASVMKIYLIGLAISSLEVSTLSILFIQGPYLLRINSMFLIFSIIGSIVGAKLIGISGAALGSVISTSIILLLNFRHTAGLVGLTLKSFQKWNSIFAILLIAAFCSAITKLLIATKIFAGSIDLVQVILGATIFTGFYIGATFIFRLGWLFNLCINFKNIYIFRNR